MDAATRVRALAEAAQLPLTDDRVEFLSVLVPALAAAVEALQDLDLDGVTPVDVYSAAGGT